MRTVRDLVMGIRRAVDPAYVILVFGVAVLAWGNVQQVSQRRVLTQQLRQASPGLTGPSESRKGDVLPSFTAQTVTGEPASIVFDGSTRYLLLVFDPRCGVCSKEAPLWRELTDEGAAAGLTVRWVSVAPAALTKAGLKRDNVESDAVIMPDMGMQRAYRVASVPQVLLVSSSGRVEWSHHGALSPREQASLREALRGHSPAVVNPLN